VHHLVIKNLGLGVCEVEINHPSVTETKMKK